MKKGFTLVEIIVVIALLGIISTIVIGNLTGLVKKNTSKLNSTLESTIIDAAILYSIESERIQQSDETTCISVNDLISKDYLNSNILEQLNNDYNVVIDKNTNTYEIDYVNYCTQEETNSTLMIMELSNYNFITKPWSYNQQIETIEFLSSIPYLKLKNINDDNMIYDVSSNQDKTIIAWLLDEDNNGMYEMYIAQKGGVKANQNSSYLFYNFNRLKNIDFSNFDTTNVTNMSYMFWLTGSYSSNFTLNLGNNFNTSNVTNMNSMFQETGFFNSNFTLNLGNNFDTSKVTNMNSMFLETGTLSTIFELDLKDKFDTSNVTDMSYMFESVGSNCNNFVLNLGNKFDTSKVTNMIGMFANCGINSTSFTLNLGKNFNTRNVTNMSYMFYYMASNTSVFSLDLGNKFDTTNVSDMTEMFNYMGYNSTSYTLNLGSNFKNIAENHTKIFRNVGGVSNGTHGVNATIKVSNDIYGGPHSIKLNQSSTEKITFTNTNIEVISY